MPSAELCWFIAPEDLALSLHSLRMLCHLECGDRHGASRSNTLCYTLWHVFPMLSEPLYWLLIATRGSQAIPFPVPLDFTNLASGTALQICVPRDHLINRSGLCVDHAEGYIISSFCPSTFSGPGTCDPWDCSNIFFAFTAYFALTCLTNKSHKKSSTSKYFLETVSISNG